MSGCVRTIENPQYRDHILLPKRSHFGGDERGLTPVPPSNVTMVCASGTPMSPFMGYGRVLYCDCIIIKCFAAVVLFAVLNGGN